MIRTALAWIVGTIYLAGMVYCLTSPWVSVVDSPF